MKQQKGIALITILVMVALATIIAATIAKRQQYTLESTAYLMRQNQSLHYAKAAEAFYSELLVLDSETSAEADFLQESWAQPMPPFPVEDGIVSGQLEDESGKFNLNSLLKADGSPNPQMQKVFEQLLQRVGLPATLSQAVMDWQDADDLSIGPMGAESQYYQGLTKPYLAANRPFQSVEELRLVRGFEAKNFDLIAPYLSALPDVETKININTAPALLLASIDEKLEVNRVADTLSQQQAKQAHFAKVSDLLETPAFNQLDAAAKTLANNVLDVKSTFFKANIEVLLNQRRRQLSSHLIRKDKRVQVYSRSLAPF